MKNNQKTMEQIAQQFELDIIYAFGSNAKETAKYINGDIPEINVFSFSDVDIGVKPRPSKMLSLKEKIQLSMVLEDLLGVNRVDLVVITEANPFLAANIIRGERLFCRDEYSADEYELYILRRAGDLAHLERERMALIMGED